MRRIVLFAGDVEASHPKPVLTGITNLISLGIVRIGKPDDHFYTELKPLTKYWDPRTEACHGMTRAYLEAHGLPPRDALMRCFRWVSSVADGGIPVLYVEPPEYDWALVDRAYRSQGIPNPFLQVRSVRALYRTLKRLPSGAEVRREHLTRDYPTDIPHLHHALGDALELEEQLRAMLREAQLL